MKDGEAKEAAKGEIFVSDQRVHQVADLHMEAGETLHAVQLKTEAAQQLAELHLLHADVSFALECMERAGEEGMPTVMVLETKTSIFAGVIAYARCFASGLRTKLNTNELCNVPGFELELHEYLLNLRNKHIAHSVNDYERGDPIGLIVQGTDGSLRLGGGVGVIVQLRIGLSAQQLSATLPHITALRDYLFEKATKLSAIAYQEFEMAFGAQTSWDLAPMAISVNRENVDKRR